MPRLPDFTSVGADPGLASGRGVVSWDTSAAAKGQQALAASLNKAGDDAAAISRQANAYAKKQEDEDNTIAAARGSSEFAVKHIGLINQFNDDDPDYNKWTERYQNDAKKIRDESAALISDPKARQMFIYRTDEQIARGSANVQKMQEGRVRTAGIADTNSQLDNLSNAAIASKDEALTTDAINQGRNTIERARRAGWIDDEQARVKSKQWVEGYAKRKISVLPANDRLDALEGDAPVGDKEKKAFDFFIAKGWTPVQAAAIVGNAVQESSLNPGARNRGDGRDGSDSIGMFQWNSDRARRFQEFAKAAGKPTGDFDTQLAFFDQELRSTESRAGEMLRSSQDSRSASAAVISALRPAGYTRSNPEGGHGFRNRWRNAENILSAYGGGKAPAQMGENKLASYLPPDEVQAMRKDAYRELDREAVEQDKASRAQSSQVKTLVEDDLASIERTGEPLDPSAISREKVAATLGNEAATQWERERDRARARHNVFSGVETLPEEEINRRVASLEPKPGVEGYAEDMASYDKARQTRDKLVKARESDPALAAESTPLVREARNNIQYETVGDRKQMAPASAQGLVKARLKAQEDMGLQNPMAVTKSEADVIARQLRVISEDNQAGMLEYMGKLEKTYGEFLPAVLASTFEHARVNRDLSVFAGDMMRKILNGQKPSVEEQAKLQEMTQQSTGSALADMAAQGGYGAGASGFSAGAWAGAGGNTGTFGQSDAPSGPELMKGISGKDVRDLIAERNNPDRISDFDFEFGPGAAEKILKEFDRRAAKPEPKGGRQ